MFRVGSVKFLWSFSTYWAKIKPVFSRSWRRDVPSFLEAFCGINERKKGREMKINVRVTKEERYEKSILAKSNQITGHRALRL